MRAASPQWVAGAGAAQPPVVPAERPSIVATGRVQWFDDRKGLGFIVPDAGGCPAFVHYSAIIKPGYKQLDPGDRVVFDLVNGTYGPYAEHVEVPQADGSTPFRDRLHLPHPTA